MLHMNGVRIRSVLLVALMFETNGGKVLQAAVGTLADSSGEVAAWGRNLSGQTDVPTGNFTAIAAGDNHSLGIRSDGTLAGWGLDSDGTNVPSGTFTAIAGGGSHSLGIRADGTLAGWGNNASGQTTVPSGTFAAIAGGYLHSLGIRSDGILFGWGYNGDGQTNVPSGTFTAIAGGRGYSLGIRTDRTLAGWGDNSQGQRNFPSGTFTAIAGGGFHSLGIRSDGTLAGWGQNNYGQTSVPSGTFSVVAAGIYHGLGIRSDGTLAGWGDNAWGQTNVPSGTFTAIADGVSHSLALRARTDYSGDLLVNYPGAATGPNGLKANLNRSINVAGDARIESPMYLYNNPVMNVAGNVTFAVPYAGFGNLVGGGAISAGGGLEIVTGTSLFVPSAFLVSTAGPLMGGGTLALTGNARVTVGLTNTSAFTGGVELQGQGSRLSFSGAGFITPANLYVYPGGEVRLTAGQRMQVADVGSNNGRIEVLGNGNVLGGAAELEFGATFNEGSPVGLITGRDAVMRFGDGSGLKNSGALALTGGVNDLFGDIQNTATGSIVVSGGAAATFYDDVTQDGTLRVSQAGSTTSTAVFLGAFTGAGGSTGGGDIFFEGDLRPGNSPAEVTYENNVVLGGGSTLEIDLGGLTPGTQHDKVIVDGSLTLDGSLNVSLINSFTPQAGNSFDILDWDSLAGTFDTLALPALTGSLFWDTSQLYTSGVLAVAAPGIAGDYNQNGTVDAADYVVWRKGLGTIYTQSDYDIWREHFGQTAGSGSSFNIAVPEPPLSVTLFIGMVAALVCRRAAVSYLIRFLVRPVIRPFFEPPVL